MPRYFLMRCAEARVLERAHPSHLWPVADALVDRLNDAFASGEGVVLIFTVTLSGSYQGAARMVSPASKDVNTGWGSMAACRLEWIKRADVPYSEAEHLINPLSDPPQPVRAGKDGTEISPSVAEELLGMLQKADSVSPKPVGSVGPSTGEQKGGPLVGSGTGTGGGGGGGMGGGSTGGALGMGGGGMGGMVGAGLMGGMPDPYLMGMHSMQGMQGMHPMLAMQMMNPAMMMQAAAAGMMNPMAAAMMMGGMPGMMAAGMRPPGGMPAAALTLPGAATGKDGGLGREAGGTDRGSGGGPGPGPNTDMGPPPGFGGPGGSREGRVGYGGGRDHEERRHPEWDREREWERERERGRYDPRFDGAPPRGGGGPPFRDGPPNYWDGPPPHGFRDGPPQFREGPPPFGRLHDRAPPGRPGYGPPPPHLSRDYPGPPPREYGGPPPGGAAVARPQRERERVRERDDRPDVLRMSYEEYVERFQQLKEVQNGGTGSATGAGTGKPIDGGAGTGAGGGGGAEGKENAAAAAGAAGDEEEAAGDGSQEAGGGDVAGGGTAGAANVQLMAEEEYVAYCQRFSAQMGMPFNAEMVRQHYKTMKEAVAAQQGQQSGGGGDTVVAS